MTRSTSTRRESFIALLLFYFLLPASAGAQIVDIVRASLGASGQQAAADSSCPQISSDGRYVAFANSDTSLVSESSFSSLFVRDLLAGTTVRADTNAQGTGANSSVNFGGCDYRLSGSGRYIVFSSSASNLVSGFGSGTQIYRKDLQTGEVLRISVSSSGTAADNNSSAPSISADGRYVLFSSDATNLVTDDTNLSRDLFVRDVDLGTTTRVSLGSGGIQANGISSGGDISNDGRYVLFSTSASNLLTSGFSGLVIRDTQANTTKQLSLGSSLSVSYDLSSDGTYAVVVSDNSSLVSGDTNSTSDVFLYEIQSDIITRVSIGPAAAQANAINYLSSTFSTISDDNRFVAFGSLATNLVEADLNGNFDVFVRDLTKNKTIVASIRPSCLSSTDNQGETSEGVGISGDGQYAVFLSKSTDLVDGDTNNYRDVFVAQLITPSKVRRGKKPTNAPNPSTCTNTASVSAPIFLTDAELAQTIGARAAKVKNIYYNFTVKASGVKREVAHKTLKRNALALRSLKSGTYTANYQLMEKVKGKGFQPLSKVSPKATFVIP